MAGVALPVAAVVLVLLACIVLLLLMMVLRRREQDGWEIDYEELEMGDVLGSGGFGEVYRAMWKVSPPPQPCFPIVVVLERINPPPNTLIILARWPGH
jgi:hypothetical protein